MVSLEPAFETKVEVAMTDAVEHELVGQQASLIYELVELTHTLLRAYGQRHGYDVESTIDSLGQPEVDRQAGRVAVTIGWESEQFSRFEFGVSPHRIDGNPILSFIWENPPDWVKQEFDQARGASGRFESGWQVFFESVQHPGIPEGRAVRDAMNAFQQVLRS